MRYKVVLLLFIGIALGCNDSDTSSSIGGTGQGGSMSIFAIDGDYLYAVDRKSIHVYTIAGGDFQHQQTVSVGFGVETIFAKAPYLYLGANDAMYIYSISQPEEPSFIFRYSHIFACDPVVVQGNRAYVTLRNSNDVSCNHGENALEIINITDPYNPELIANHPMESPHGLGISGNTLFICEGENGFKMFDVSDETNLKLIDAVRDHFAFDVIVQPGRVIVTGDDGIFQYSYESNKLSLLSTIPIAPEE